MDETMICGRVHKFGDDINTDLISPAQYMEFSDEVIAAHAMEGVDCDFLDKINAGDIIVAGKNFGSGSSRETAPIALKRIGISVVIAEFYARIFYRNCINIGLPALVCKEAHMICDGDVLEVLPSSGIIKNITRGKEYHCEPMSEDVMKIVKNGGLLNDLEQRRKNLKGELNNGKRCE